MNRIDRVIARRSDPHLFAIAIGKDSMSDPIRKLKDRERPTGRSVQGVRWRGRYPPFENGRVRANDRDYTTRRPWMIWMSTDASARSSKIWINPPSVYALLTPSNHNTMSTTKIVQSICFSLSVTAEKNDQSACHGACGRRALYCHAKNDAAASHLVRKW
jgi:hypothetical protein